MALDKNQATTVVVVSAVITMLAGVGAFAYAKYRMNRAWNTEVPSVVPVGLLIVVAAAAASVCVVGLVLVARRESEEEATREAPPDH